MKIITLYTLIKEEVHILRRRYRGQLHNPRHPRRHFPLSNWYQTIFIITISSYWSSWELPWWLCWAIQRDNVFWSDKLSWIWIWYILNIYLGQENKRIYFGFWSRCCRLLLPQRAEMCPLYKSLCLRKYSQNTTTNSLYKSLCLRKCSQA